MEQRAPVTNERLTKAVNQSSSLFFALFMGLAIIVDYSLGFFDDTSTVYVAVLLAILFVVAFLQHRGTVSVDRSPIVVLSVYHAIYAASAILIVPFGSAYIFVGLHLVHLASYAFGKYGATLSTIAIASVVAIDFLLLGDLVTKHDFGTLVRSLSVFALLASMVYFSVHVARREIFNLSTVSMKLKAEHQRMLALINSMGDAVLSTDQAGNILSYNGAALDILDTNETITGRPLSAFLDLKNADGETIDLVASTAEQNRNVRRRDVVHTYSDGEKINLYTNVTPVKIGYGKKSESGFTIILRDITKEKSLEEERDEFISVVSHELRTPITVTEGKVSNAMLHNKREVKDRKIAKSLDEAHDQVVFLAAMINDLATLARAERGALDFNPEKINPANLVRDLKAAYEVEAGQKGLKIKTSIGSRLPSVTTSELYLKEILQNFITNSIKYTKKGSVTIGVAARGKGVTFTVKDTGIGISKSDQKKLFDKFFRSEDYRTRESAGTGLGLYVTTKLAELIKAKITVSSTLNKGSAFSVTIRSLPTKKPRRHSSSTS